MALSMKNLILLLPFIGACCIGIYYALSERLLSSISIQSYVLVYSILTIFLLAVLHYTTPYKIDLTPMLNGKIATYVLLAICASLTAWLCSLVTIKSISATYASVGEISYPLFTVFFAWLFFSARELDKSTAIGAMMIIAGSAIVITDKFK